MRDQRLLVRALGGATAFWFAAWLAYPLPDLWRTAAMGIGWSVVCVLAAVSAVVVSRRSEERPARTSLLLVAAGSLAWGAGQAVWTAYEVVGEGAPYPSLADVGFVAALPLLAAAVLTWPRVERSWRPGDAADGLLMLGAVLMASYAFVLQPVLAHGLEGTSELVLLAYPLAVAVLLGAILVGATLHTFLQPGRLLVLALGLGMIVSDTAFAVTGGNDRTSAAMWDAGWTVAFALLGAAALLPASWGERLRPPGSAGPLAAIALLAAATGFHELASAGGPSAGDAAGTVLMLVLFVALAVRYVVVARSGMRKAEHLEELRATLEHEFRILEATIEASRTGMCLYDADGRPAVRNGAWARLAGDGPEGRGRWAGVVGDSAVRFWTPEGRCLSLASRPLTGGETLVTVDDVTEEEREREVRDRFLAEIVGAQEHEARRIAELLHDDVVQRLTALGLRIELTAMRNGDDALIELAREASAVTGSIRRLLIELYPAVLESQGLGPAIEAAAGSLRAVGVAVAVDELDLRFPPELEQLAYRLVQEAFANALKHANATHVSVSLHADEERLRVAVADDGEGFEADRAADATSRGSLGLHLVRGRLELAGGLLHLESRPGEGTTLTFELPLKQHAAELPRVNVAA